jgi:uncharacterized protein (DUF433 family)
VPTRTATPTAHIWLDEQGRAWIDDTNGKVIEIAGDLIGQGYTAEQMYEAHGGHYSMAQIHAALSYYYDHKEEFDAEIERQDQEFLRLREENKDSPVMRKLRALGKIP